MTITAADHDAASDPRRAQPQRGCLDPAGDDADHENPAMIADRCASINLQEVERISREDHRHAFMAFVAGLLGDVDRYLEHQDFDPVRDGAGYRLAGLCLNDAESQSSFAT